MTRQQYEITPPTLSAEQRFAAEGADPAAMTREQLRQFIASDIVRWRQVALEARIKQE